MLVTLWKPDCKRPGNETMFLFHRCSEKIDHVISLFIHLLFFHFDHFLFCFTNKKNPSGDKNKLKDNVQTVEFS